MSNEITITEYTSSIPTQLTSNGGFVSERNLYVEIRNQEPVFHIPTFRLLDLDIKEISRSTGEVDTMYIVDEFDIIPLLVVGTFMIEDPIKNILVSLFYNGVNQNIPKYNRQGKKIISHTRLFGHITPKGCKEGFLGAVIGRGKGQTNNINNRLAAISMPVIKSGKQLFGGSHLTFKGSKKPVVITNSDGSEQSAVYLADIDISKNKPPKIDIAKAFKMSTAWATKLVNGYDIPL